MYRRFIVIITIIITICAMTGCKVSGTIGSTLQESQNRCLKQNQIDLMKIFDAYQYARSMYNTNHIIDSIIISISLKNQRDTIFIIEDCSPPLYSYYAIIWNRNNGFTLYGSGNYEKRILNNENTSKTMKLIEKWDKSEIISKSHEKPLIYYGEWMQSCIASRIILNNSKVESIESVFYSEIDWENDRDPWLLE